MDLAGLKDRSREAILIAILDPSRAVEDQYVLYNVVMAGGRILSGILKEEGGSNLTLLAADGNEQVILRSQILSLHSTGLSLMPEGLEEGLDSRDMADLIAFVQQIAR